MNEIFLVYLITVAISLATAVTIILMFGTVAYVVFFISVLCIDDDYPSDKSPVSSILDWLLSTYKKFFTAFIVLTSLVVLIPDKKDFYFIIGGSVALSLSQNEEAQKLPNNVLKALNAFLEETVEAEETK